VKRVLQILKPVVIPGVVMSVLQNVHEYIVKNLPGLIVCVCVASTVKYFQKQKCNISSVIIVFITLWFLCSSRTHITPRC